MKRANNDSKWRHRTRGRCPFVYKIGGRARPLRRLRRMRPVMMVCGVKPSHPNCPGRQFPRPLQLLTHWGRTRTGLKRLGEDFFQQLSTKSRGLHPAGSLARPAEKEEPCEKPKKTMFGHKWQCLRTGAHRATSTGSGATDVGPTWGCLIHLGKRSSVAQEKYEACLNREKMRPINETRVHQAARSRSGAPGRGRSASPDQVHAPRPGLRSGESVSPDQAPAPRPGLRSGGTVSPD